ncbi:MAG: hypothetical protein ACUVWO_16225, partial [Thermodesulfobacteriota bacterium]
MKPRLRVSAPILHASLPARERGLKQIAIYVFHSTLPSLPARERGLKPTKMVRRMEQTKSLPARERGLKHQKERNILRRPK